MLPAANKAKAPFDILLYRSLCSTTAVMKNRTTGMKSMMAMGTDIPFMMTSYLIQVNFSRLYSGTNGKIAGVFL